MPARLIAAEQCGFHTEGEYMNDTVAIMVRGVSKVFSQATEHEVRALDNVSVSIAKNEFFTLLGPSGCGKTTLLRLIAGFEHPTNGAILLEGTDISALPPFQRPVNTVFQNYALFPHMTVAQNIGFGLEMQARSKTEVETTVSKMLDLVRMKRFATGGLTRSPEDNNKELHWHGHSPHVLKSYC